MEGGSREIGVIMGYDGKAGQALLIAPDRSIKVLGGYSKWTLRAEFDKTGYIKKHGVHLETSQPPQKVSSVVSVRSDGSISMNDLKNKGNSLLIITDLNGRQLVSENIPSIEGSWSWSPAGISKGLYVYSIRTNSSTYTGKISIK